MGNPQAPTASDLPRTLKDLDPKLCSSMPRPISMDRKEKNVPLPKTMKRLQRSQSHQRSIYVYIKEII
ncbi:hypothetical protein P280DRAFT_473948 [Massarina eburnea CBS 473.64]|uniref:Uncharacterized protein n=1 Tax=Massarina eburnea CBS 473.64 TaxID=1395130 RepID=A0A6A6RM86_9PLEO|nr:hypothetical protein P280DRAFT_473948 [Massarina eburnea CBS 473.64]